MKKPHLILLVVTAVMAFFSAYSLAAINQVYKIDYKWYSEYMNKFVGDYRITSSDRWHLPDYPGEMELDVITGYDEAQKLSGTGEMSRKQLLSADFNNQILLYCSLGLMDNPDYRIKVIAIAQRGNVVEVKVSLNSPEAVDEDENIDGGEQSSEAQYRPQDIVRIDKAAFPVKGRLYFIFKSQSGKQIGEEYCIIQ